MPAQNKNTEFCAPLTAFDWNETDPNIIGTSSIDTTCTIWDITKMQAKTQLIAHDKEVYDLAFASGVNVFASVGADGSVRVPAAVPAGAHRPPPASPPRTQLRWRLRLEPVPSSQRLLAAARTLQAALRPRCTSSRVSEPACPPLAGAHVRPAQPGALDDHLRERRRPGRRAGASDSAGVE